MLLMYLQCTLIIFEISLRVQGCGNLLPKSSGSYCRPTFNEVAAKLAAIEEDFRQRCHLDAIRAPSPQLPRSQSHPSTAPTQSWHLRRSIP